ncbi:hypothetical protein BESB_060790 [Besnoitia besnoiti]|uniref:Transmembrane protein n=1 Tax=Besnoitia besnoiti TaxID=94643 RepID=A0A2A9MIH4_BESBE|nr:hypothetical protein BESB_060790 [Besnoitia besnoiti]PFH35192.1 hypothetical protein BESB_060790 [Besnoitia besnoiti]
MLGGLLKRRRPHGDRGVSRKTVDQENQGGGGLAVLVSEAATSCRRTSNMPRCVKRRLVTAAELVEAQADEGRLSVVGSEVDATNAKDQPLVQAWFVDLVFQLLTALALCCLAFAVGIIIGSIMCRTTLFSGASLDRLEGRSPATHPWVHMYLPDASTAAKWRNPNPPVKAVLRGAFDVTLPEFCLGSYVEALSAVATLSYLPADTIGTDPSETCFTSSSAGSKGAPSASNSTSPADSGGVSSGATHLSAPGDSSPVRRLSKASGSDEKSFVSSQYVPALLAPDLGTSLRANLVTRAIYGLSLIASAGSESGGPVDVPTFSPVTGGTVGVSRVFMQHSPASSYPVGIMRNAAKHNPALAPPTLLIHNVVPFIVGLPHGLNSARFTVTLNVPLVEQDERVLQALRGDCGMGRIYFGVELTIQAVRVMFFTHHDGSHPVLPFRLPCSVFTVADEAQWPPHTPPSFTEGVVRLAQEYSTVRLIFGDR